MKSVEPVRSSRVESTAAKLRRVAISSWCSVLVAAGALAGFFALSETMSVNAQSSCNGVAERYSNFNDVYFTLDESCKQFNMSDLWSRLSGVSDPNLAIDAFGKRQDLIAGSDGNLYMIAKGGNRIEIKIPLAVSGNIQIRQTDGTVSEITQSEIEGVINQVAMSIEELPDVSTIITVPESDQIAENTQNITELPQQVIESDTDVQPRQVDLSLYNLINTPETGMPLVCGIPLAVYLVGLFIYSKLSRNGGEKYTSSKRANEDQDYDKSARDAANEYIIMHSGSESDDRSTPPNPTPMRNKSTSQGQRSLPNTGIGEGMPVINNDKAVGFPEKTMINDGLFEVLKDAGKAVEGIWWDVEE